MVRRLLLTALTHQEAFNVKEDERNGKKKWESATEKQRENYSQTDYIDDAPTDKHPLDIKCELKSFNGGQKTHG